MLFEGPEGFTSFVLQLFLYFRLDNGIAILFFFFLKDLYLFLAIRTQELEDKTTRFLGLL